MLSPYCVRAGKTFQRRSHALPNALAEKQLDDGNSAGRLHRVNGNGKLLLKAFELVEAAILATLWCCSEKEQRSNPRATRLQTG